jgi:hypothetical protein
VLYNYTRNRDVEETENVCGLEGENSWRHVTEENKKDFSSKEGTLKMRGILPS